MKAVSYCLMLATCSFLSPVFAAQSAATGTPEATYNNPDYQLGYDAYLGAGKLLAAYHVAAKAVHSKPKDLTWRRRLANTAAWVSKPQVALDNWLYIAQHSNSSKAWKAVHRIAPALDDHHALLLWHQYNAATHPNSAKALQGLAQAYERIGLPQQGLAALGRLKRQHPNVSSYMAEMQLALLLGEDQRVLDDVKWLNQHAKPRQQWLLAAAFIHYRHGRLAQAQKLLADVSAQMPTSAVAYWRSLAELSHLIGKQQQALDAYQRVYASQSYKRSDVVNLASLIQSKKPLVSARLNAAAFRQFGYLPGASTALYLWASHAKTTKAKAFLASLTAAQLTQLEKQPNFLLQRGLLFEQLGKWRAALADYRAGMDIAPDNTSLMASRVFLLAEHHQLHTLRQLLVEKSDFAEDNSALWGAWAAGWQYLGRLQLALPWLAKRYHAQPNQPLYALAYADVLAQTGKVKKSRQLYRQVRHRQVPRHSADKSLATGTDDELKRTLLLNTLKQLPVDARYRRLKQLVHHSLAANNAVSPWLRDRLLNAAWSSGAPDSLPAMISTQLPTQPDTPVPGWSALAMALHDYDQTRMANLLDTKLGELPAADRVTAAQRLGRYRQATSLAFASASLQPKNEELQQLFRDRALHDGGWLKLSHAQQQQGQLQRAPTLLSWRSHLHAQHAFSLYAEQAELTDDDQQLQLPFSQQRQFGLGVQGKGRALQWQLWGTWFDSLTTVAGAKGQLHWQIDSQLAATVAAGLRQTTDANALLRRIGQRDFASLGINWAITGRDSLWWQGRIDQLQAQKGGDLGQLNTQTIGFDHRLFSGTPDWLLKSNITRVTSQFASTVPDQLNRLLPTGLSVDSDYFVPSAYTEYAVAVSVGENATQHYQRAWHGFGEIGLSHNTLEGGIGYRYRVGLVGSLFGNDQLRLVADGMLGKQAIGETSRGVQIEYQHYY